MPDNQEPVSLRKTIESWKPTVDFIRSTFLLFFVVGLLLTLLICPRGFWFLVNRSGFDVEEINIPIIGKLTRAKSNVDLAAALRDGSAVNSKAQAQLKAASDLLSQLNVCFTSQTKLMECAKDKNLLEQLVSQEKNLQQFQVIASKTSTAIDRTLQANASVINQSQLVVGASLWGVVFGGDVSKEAAEDEIKKAEKMGISGLTIYHRQNSYRSLAVFDSHDTAKDAQSRLKQINRGAYVVAVDRWCQNARQVGSSTEYALYECGS